MYSEHILRIPSTSKRKIYVNYRFKQENEPELESKKAPKVFHVSAFAYFYCYYLKLSLVLMYRFKKQSKYLQIPLTNFNK